MSLWLPQLIYIILVCLGMGMIIAKHGQKQDDYNAWTSGIAGAIILALLYWGGFFSNMFQ